MEEMCLGEMDPMEAMVRQAEEERNKAICERDAAIADRDFARKQATDLARHLKREREIFAKEIHKANTRFVKSIAKPFALWFAAISFAFVINFLMKGELVSPLLGYPVIYVCINICSVFTGILIERIEIRSKAKYHIGKDD